MRLIKITFFTGLFVIIVPVSGLPLYWKFFLTVVLGMVLIGASIFEYLELLKSHEEDGQEHFDFEHIDKKPRSKPIAKKLAVKSDNLNEE